MALCAGEVGENLARVLRGSHLLIDCRDFTLLIDQITDPAGPGRLWIGARPIRDSGLAFRIA
jgi:hypothetical protein